MISVRVSKRCGGCSLADRPVRCCSACLSAGCLLFGACSGGGESVGVGAGFDDVAAEGWSTMAAQRRGSVKVLVQPEKDSLESMATLSCSAFRGVPDARVTILAKEIHEHHACTT